MGCTHVYDCVWSYVSGRLPLRAGLPLPLVAWDTQEREGGRYCLSAAYRMPALAICDRLFWQFARLPASRAIWTAGSNRPARRAMIVITTSISTMVKACRRV